MPEDALKVTRNFRGGANRAVRVTAGVLLVVYSYGYLRRLLDHSSPAYNHHISGGSAALMAAAASVVLLYGLYLLKGTIVRFLGVVLTFGMVIPVLIGHVLTIAGLSEAFCRIPIAILILGIVIMYTGEAEWTLVPFAFRQCAGKRRISTSV